MARGNLFLGMGRGSVGDVTFYRSDGQQLSRARNRRPRNPRSQGQLYQRAIMATIVKAYQAGQAIFDHSFQGYSKGSGCQRQFTSLNANFLRDAVSADINSGRSAANQISRVVSPGANTSVANAYIISRGSYAQRLFDWNPAAQAFIMPQVEQEGTQGNAESVATYAARVGLVAGDIYTLCLFAERETPVYEPSFTDDAHAFLMDCEFGWVRMIVKEDLDEDITTAATMSQFFDFQTSGGNFKQMATVIAAKSPGVPITMVDLLTGVTGFLNTGAMGVIRSRLDQDLRSDSQMFPIYGEDASNEFGIVPAYILDVWGARTAEIGHSELILEGGGA